MKTLYFIDHYLNTVTLGNGEVAHRFEIKSFEEIHNLSDSVSYIV